MILDKKRDVLFVPFSYNYTNENYKQHSGDMSRTFFKRF